MKKLITLIAISIIAIIVTLFITGCGNKDMFDTNYTFDTAYVKWPDGSMKVLKIKQWTDYENGEQIQIITTDGTIYLINSINSVLVRTKN